ICNLPPDQYQQVCQNARDRVKHLDWSNIVTQTMEAYQEILDIKLTASPVKKDMLSSLIRFFSRGDLRDYLLEVIEEVRHRPPKEVRKLPHVKVPTKMESWIRVPSSTWLISGLTVFVSMIGFLFMRGRDKKED
ncbi:MAG: hypothetical protein KAH12_06545, partial [Anaerolineales bacterium]|nr:hypothetical protein [Anaerolineales bacterium]